MIPIDYYIIARYGTQVDPAFTPNTVKHIMEEYFGFTIHMNEVDVYLKRSKPKKKHVVEALLYRRFSQTDIAVMLGCSQASVSKAMSNSYPLAYTNLEMFDFEFQMNMDIGWQKFKKKLETSKQDYDREYTERVLQKRKLK